jgi:hypothetical protein
MAGNPVPVHDWGIWESTSWKGLDNNGSSSLVFERTLGVEGI